MKLTWILYYHDKAPALFREQSAINPRGLIATFESRETANAWMRERFKFLDWGKIGLTSVPNREGE